MDLVWDSGMSCESDVLSFLAWISKESSAPRRYGGGCFYVIFRGRNIVRQNTMTHMRLDLVIAITLDHNCSANKCSFEIHLKWCNCYVTPVLDALSNQQPWHVGIKSGETVF
jgi:hypothetical protein